MAQGVANLASPLFGGIPATGAIARTATNIRSGAKTPVAGMIHAVTLLLILLLPAPLARFVPLATLSAVLFVVAYNMGEWREIGTILRLSKADIAVWAVTFALTVLADLTVAVEVGHGPGRASLYLSRLRRPPPLSPVTRRIHSRTGVRTCCRTSRFPGTSPSFASMGRFCFGTTDKLAESTVEPG